MAVVVCVIPDSIPVLIGLDIVDANSIQTLTVSNEIECVAENWKVPATRQMGHVYWKWKNISSSFLTRASLERLHRHLLHPSPRKLYNTLARANLESFGPHIRPTKAAKHAKITLLDNSCFASETLTKSALIRHSCSISCTYRTVAAKTAPYCTSWTLGLSFRQQHSYQMHPQAACGTRSLRIRAGAYIGFPSAC